MSGLTLSMYLGYSSLVPGSGDGVRKAYFVLTGQFFSKIKTIDRMLIMLTTGYCNVFWGPHSEYKISVQTLASPPAVLWTHSSVQPTL